MKSLVLAGVFLFASALFLNPALAQKVPKDFSLSLLAGTIHQNEPDAELDTNKVSIGADGSITFNRWISPYGDLPSSDAKLSKKQLKKVYKALIKYRVFGFKDNYFNYRIAGGDVAILTVTANGKTKNIQVGNIVVEDFYAMLDQINDVLPLQRWILTMAMISDDRVKYPVTPR